MSILKKLFGAQAPTPTEETSSVVADIAARLDHLAPDEARRLAALAMVLARAARADLEIDADEVERMAAVVESEGGLEPEHAQLVAEMAAHRHELLGAGEDYLATREYRQLTDREGAIRLLRCLFEVTAADDSISLVEEEELRQVASELGLEHADYTRVRSEFSAQREVMRGLGGRPRQR